MLLLRLSDSADFHRETKKGFVSNKDGDEDSDPVEKLLYGMFFAASARTTIRELAHVLDAPILEVTEAASVACRLGFARRTTQERRVSISHMIQSPDGTAGFSVSELNNDTAEGSPSSAATGAASVDQSLADTADSGTQQEERKGIAFVVDTQVIFSPVWLSPALFCFFELFAQSMMCIKRVLRCPKI